MACSFTSSSLTRPARLARHLSPRRFKTQTVVNRLEAGLTRERLYRTTGRSDPGISDSEKVRLLKSLTRTLTVRGSRPLLGIALGLDRYVDAIRSDSGRSTEKDPCAPVDPNETAFETTDTDTGPSGGPYACDSISHGSLETVHHYKLLRPLAQGGMGRVWSTRDIDLGREVAIKQVIARFADRTDFQARFMFEAKALANLEHPGVVGIYGLGRDPAGHPFFVMRLVKGETLSAEIRRFHERASSTWRRSERLLALRRLLTRFIALCNVVAYAHSRGVLHRDIKPQNVILGKYGETFLVDWGLAKVLFLPDAAGEKLEGPSAFHPDDVHGRTEFGVAVGTPGYMSPEQAAGRNDLMEPAADIYSLGATLYDILTGRPAFAGRTLKETLERVAKGEFPKPREIAPDLPAELEAICLKAMAVRSEDRFASATSLADDVERWLAGAPVSAHDRQGAKSMWPSSDFLRRWWIRTPRDP